MKLIITRHGETEENKEGIIQGHLPGKLSADGIQQAKKVAERLKDEKIDFIYSSDLDRTWNTAKEIIKHHPEAKVETTEDLRERNLGEFQGRKRSEFDLSNGALEPKEGESMLQLYERAAKFLEQILPKHRNDTVLLVGHNGINIALIANIMGKPCDEMRSVGKQHNTSVNIFEIDEDRNHTIHAYNCIEHLS